jgi:flagellar biosynthesis component FlhA
MNQSIPIITISALLLFTVLWVTNDDKEQSVKTEIEPIAQSEQEAPEPEAAEFGSAETRVAEEYGRELASLQASEHLSRVSQ